MIRWVPARVGRAVKDCGEGRMNKLRNHAYFVKPEPGTISWKCNNHKHGSCTRLSCSCGCHKASVLDDDRTR